MAKLRLTIACGDYDLIRPLKEGIVEAEGLDLIFLTEMGPRERHWRMGRRHEFDICEENVAAFFILKDQGAPLTGLPVFLHRRFRHGFVFVNTGSSIDEPSDLAGKTIAGTNFQPAANVWMRGILEEHYGLPHRSVRWLVDRTEDVAFDVPSDLRIEMKQDPRSLGDLVAAGEVPAMISPTVPQPFVDGHPGIKRMFSDYVSVELDYFRKTGIFPIMHVTTIRQEIVEKFPWVPTNLVKALNASKALAYKRLANPRMVPLAFVRTAFEEQLSTLGPDPWEYGLTEKNRRNLQTVQRYAHQQGLTRSIKPLNELFADTDLGDSQGSTEV